MPKNVVVVESPAKVRTIKKYLGKDFEVLASYGHVRDLIPKNGAVEPAKDFLMHYDPIARNQPHVKKISNAVKGAEALYLATDPDREGEAIAWHVLELLRESKVLKDQRIYRVAFNEITAQAIKQAVANPRAISIDLVNAQQARRALDYLVGFNLSPLLWKKIRAGLSAGRVQSPALCMLVERELEIEAFKSREYWTVKADLTHHQQPFTAKLWRLHGKKLTQFSIGDEATANSAKEHLSAAAGGALHVHQVEKKQRKRQPAAPFITSTLQQEAAHKLKFSAQRTMRIAQQLYEGISIGTESVGLITYMRTDSVVLAQEALADIRAYIEQHYGRDNLPPAARSFKTRARNAQEAHEAIRPTAAQRTPQQIGSYLGDDQRRLYELIWKRTVASQMLHATIDTVSVNLGCEPLAATEPADLFRASGSTIAVPGFLMLYEETAAETPKGKASKAAVDSQATLPVLAKGDRVALRGILPEQHFTEPPPRYSEASLIRTLEEYGIGRPSTYAQILHVLQQREYAELRKRYFHPTDIGRLVSHFLTKHFATYVDYKFTARLEDDLDRVAKGERQWLPLLRDFWDPFSRTLEEKASVSRSEAGHAQVLGLDPRSNKKISVRMGRYGPCVQLGDTDDDEKPRFFSLPKHLSMTSVTLEQALELIQLPRDLGHTPDGEPVSSNIGRFGPYVKYGAKYVSLGSDDDPYTIELPHALELIEAKRLIEAQREIRIFEEAGIRILAGRFGPYITDSKKNVRVPKGKEPSDIGLEEAQELLAAAPAAKSKPARAPTKRRTKQR